MKKHHIIIIVVVVFLFIISLMKNFSSFQHIVDRKDARIYNEVADKLKGVYHDYQMDVDVKYGCICFTNDDDHEIEYNFYNNTINSVSIRYNLRETTLSSEEIIQRIEELYQVVTGNFYLIKEYFDKDFLIRKEYYINDHDKSYLKDFLDYNTEYSGWNVGYDYEENHHYSHIDYYLTTAYNHEGFYNFIIYIS